MYLESISVNKIFLYIGISRLKLFIIKYIILYLIKEYQNIKIYKKRKKEIQNQRLTIGIRSGGDYAPPSGSEKPQSGCALCAVFSPPHLGRRSLLRIALLPAPNVVYLKRYAQVLQKI